MHGAFSAMAERLVYDAGRNTLEHSDTKAIKHSSQLSKYKINTENCSFLHVFAFLIFHPFFQGGS